jgi:hypothetical protein
MGGTSEGALGESQTSFNKSLVHRRLGHDPAYYCPKE